MTERLGRLLFLSAAVSGSSALHGAACAAAESTGAGVLTFDDPDALIVAAQECARVAERWAVVIGPDIAAPLRAARRIARQVAEARFILVADPARESELRREAGYAAPPGGHWILVSATDPRLAERMHRELQHAGQHQRMRTTVDRMKLRLSAPPPVDAGEYRRLVASDRYLASVLQHAHDAIVTLDWAGHVLSWNGGAERLFGVSSGATRGVPLASLFREPSAVQSLVGDARARQVSAQSLRIEVAGIERFIDANFNPLHGDGIGGTGIISILRDATARHRAEETLRETSRQKDEFLAMLAHELRNPLAPIRNAAEVLSLLHRADARSTAATAVIARQVGHLSALLDDLLDVARVTRGAVVLDRRPVQVATVVADAVEQAQRLVDQRGHRLVVGDLTHGIAVMGDAKRLTQVLANLLINAAKFSAPGGEIRIGFQVSVSRVAIAISDTGIGIEPALVEKVFDLFVQGDQSTDRAAGGLGIGLALVRSMVEMHGGTVRASSRGRGHGSVFTVELPRAVDAAVGCEHVGPRQTGTVRALRLMVVDDNEDAAQTLGAYLEAVGHRVEVETDPRAALAHAVTVCPDVFILDIGMPHLDGFELARRLRALPWERQPLIIALTGYGSEADRAQAREAGFDHHLVKPLNPEQLTSLLGSATRAVH